MDANLGGAGASIGLLSDVIRYLSFLLDMIPYSLIPIVFDLIYKLYDLPKEVASVEALNTLSNSIYSLLAIFMFFKMAFSLLGMLIDPNMIADKEKGAGKLVSNVFVTLVLIVAVPLIFDYAFKAQSIIMEKRLIETAVFGEDFTKEEQLTLGKRLSLSVWGLFLQPMADNGDAIDAYNAIFVEKDPYTPYFALFKNINDTTKDAGFWEHFLKYYAGSLLNMTGVGAVVGVKMQLEAYGFLSGENRYQVSYVAIISTAAGFYLLWSFLKMCIDVSYRAIKLYALRMLAPVAIVSYIDPKSGKNGVFSKWIAECVKTYASLFVRIFVFAIAAVILNEIDITSSGENFIERLFFTLAIVAFLKTAPKFIDGILGTELSKDSESKFGADLLKQGLGGLGMATVGGAIGLASAKKLGYNGGRGLWEGAKAGFTGGIEAVNKKDPIGVIGGLAKAGNGANAMRKYYGLPTAAEARKQKTEADLALNSAKEYANTKDNTSKKVYDKMSYKDFDTFIKDPNTMLSASEQNMKARWIGAKNDAERDQIKKEFTDERFKFGYSEKGSNGQVIKHSGYMEKDAAGNYVRKNAVEASDTIETLTSDRGKRYRASLGTVDAISASFDKSSEIGKLYLEEEQLNRDKIVEEQKSDNWSKLANVAGKDKVSGGSGYIYVNEYGTDRVVARDLYTVTSTKNAAGVETFSFKYRDKDAAGNPIVTTSTSTYASREEADAAAEQTAITANGYGAYDKYDETALSELATATRAQADFYAGKMKEKSTAREDRIKNPKDGKEARDARIANLIEIGKRRAG